MQFITAIVAVAALVSHTNAMAVRSDACADVCQTIKPECSADTTARGFEGCWGCCEPLTTISPSDNQVCIEECRAEKPTCAADMQASGVEGCWGCCVLNTAN